MIVTLKSALYNWYNYKNNTYYKLPNSTQHFFLVSVNVYFHIIIIFQCCSCGFVGTRGIVVHIKQSDVKSFMYTTCVLQSRLSSFKCMFFIKLRDTQLFIKDINCMCHRLIAIDVYVYLHR